jgi:hypothetical protein
MKRQGSVVGGIPAGRGDLEEKDQIITNAIQVPAPKDRLLIHTFACSSLFAFARTIRDTPVLPPLVPASIDLVEDGNGTRDFLTLVVPVWRRANARC